MMPKVQAATVCRECGAPRDMTFKLALCADHAKAWRAEQNAKHGATSKTRGRRLAEAYASLRVRDLIAARRA
jgi:hypothetical protein